MVCIFWPDSMKRTVFGVGLFTVNYPIPLSIMGYSYGRIVWVLTRRIDRNIDAPAAIRNDTFHTARKSMVKTFLLVSIALSCVGLVWNFTIYCIILGTRQIGMVHFTKPIL